MERIDLLSITNGLLISCSLLRGFEITLRIIPAIRLPVPALVSITVVGSNDLLQKSLGAGCFPRLTAVFPRVMCISGMVLFPTDYP